MKKNFIIFLLILFLPTILAANITIKENYNSQETLIAKISGEFLQPILDENIFFYRAHVKVPMDYDVTKIQDDYYVYTILPQTNEQKNYSIRIKNIRYIQDGSSTDEEIKKDFTISNQTADFNVNPGFVVADDDFSIEIKNLKNSEIEIKSNYGEKSLKLESQKTKKINFELNDFDGEFQLLELVSDNTTYEIPFYLSGFENKKSFWDFLKPEEKKDEGAEQEEKQEQPTPQAIKKCSEMNGEICSADEECVGDFTYALDEKCCLGTCEKKQKTISWKFFGWGIIILIIIIMIVFFAKYKGTKKKFDLLNIAKKK